MDVTLSQHEAALARAALDRYAAALDRWLEEHRGREAPTKLMIAAGTRARVSDVRASLAEGATVATPEFPRWMP